MDLEWGHNYRAEDSSHPFTNVQAKRLLLRNVPVLEWKPLASDHASLSVTAHHVPVQAFPVYHGGGEFGFGFGFGLWV